MSPTRRLVMVDRDHPELSVVRQCALLDLSRSSVYYRPTEVAASDLELMALMDRQYLLTPFYGSRRMAAWLRAQGYPVNRKRVQRLMRVMGIEAIYQRPNTSRPSPEHRVYPYLLRGLAISGVNQVWAADITYIPMARGFLYLVAIMDWYSRYVLAWRVSNTLDVDFCVEALEEALSKGTPEIFNTDQGSQFTSDAFTGVLLQQGIRISMDGKGRCMDNIFVERLWRSVKYEEVYLKAYPNGSEAKAGIGAYLRLYNQERPHQALDYQTPRQVFEAGRPLAKVVAGNRPPTGQEPERRCSPNREVVSWSWIEPVSLVMTTSNTAVDSLNLASSLSK
jgi:putative transposase